jgi:hypothetical protein
MILRENVLVPVKYSIPLYDIGYEVEYGDKDLGMIVGVDLSCFTDANKNIITQILYTLDNGDIVNEDDILLYYDPNE